jgi:malonate transporter
LIVILGILFPVFAIVLCGVLAGRLRVLDETGGRALNQFVYYFALPPLLFKLTAQAPSAAILRWDFIAAYLAVTLGTLLLALAGGRWAFRLRGPTLGFHGLAAVFGNTAYIGVPLFLSAFGPEGALPAVVATVTTNALFIGGAVALVEAGGVGRRTVARALWTALLSLLRNPLILASLAGLLFSFFSWSLPAAIWRLLDLMGGAAVPGALFALGLSLTGRRLDAGLAEIGWLVALKLIVHPLLAWLLVSSLPNLDPLWGRAVILLAAMPTGSLVYVLAQRYDQYVERVSTAILASTALAAVSLFVLMRLLSVGG